MANKKKEVYKVKPLNENKKNIIAALIDEYDIETADDIQEALKDLLGGTIKSMMETEMDDHLGYESYERSDNDNYRNGTKPKTVRGNYGEFQIDVPQDRQSTFEPKVVKKRQKCLLQNKNGESCRAKMEKVASPKWRKMQSSGLCSLT